MKTVLKNTIFFLSIFLIYTILINILAYIVSSDGTLNSKLFRTVDLLLFSLIGLLWFLSLSYKRTWSFKQRKVRWFLIPGALMVIAVFISLRVLHHQVNNLYHHIKEPVRTVEGDIFTKNPKLGQAARMNASGFHSYFQNQDTLKRVSIFTNEEGFRIPENYSYSHGNDSLMIFLGCSYTWGDYCKAEETYPFLVAESLGYNCLNAGQSAYGLSQMLPLAEKLIRQKRPKYLFVQYSSWLADRAKSKYAHISHGARPYPYFVKKDTGIHWHPPLFQTKIYDLPFQKYRGSEPTLPDRIKFHIEIGLQGIYLDKLKRKLYSLAILLRLKPESHHNNQEIERHVYSRIHRLCQDYGTQMVVVHVGARGWKSMTRSLFQQTVPENIYNNLIFIDTDSVLMSSIKSIKDYRRKYAHWALVNGDSVNIDLHPNEQAHEIIAKTIMQQLKTGGSENLNKQQQVKN
ncbi:hypothetical protein QQ008_14695 [Fulvivirgaceae bacterium BMA10]|uniref:SGNH/GDSL hydrolase family protein n=1 Tax=Splendidivirga corallicola TaxID=3051826 RepID=A0ABT8KR06_9BACT|nr:hypothetical protein [Fulvivirgaceae bacterium BMA10]